MCKKPRTSATMIVADLVSSGIDVSRKTIVKALHLGGFRVIVQKNTRTQMSTSLGVWHHEKEKYVDTLRDNMEKSALS